MKPRNYIAKHAHRLNRAVVFKDKKKASRKVRGQKHKGKQ